jgi:hypothetical protein
MGVGRIGWTPRQKCGTNLLLHLPGEAAGTSVTRLSSSRHEHVVAGAEGDDDRR